MDERIESPQSEIIGELFSEDTFDRETARKLTTGILKRRQPGGRYVVEKELARGGMGIIHTVMDQDLRRTSAVKIIAPELIEDERKLRAFVAEARVTAQLEHPNIIPVHEIGMIGDSGCPYYTMKLVEGEALDEIIDKLAANDDDYLANYTRHKLLNIFRKVCDAVSYAHAHGVIHRDLKPENIMIGRFGEVLVMDWGLAKYLGPKDGKAGSQDFPGDSGLRDPTSDRTGTADGVIKGSLAYLSPEQAFGDLAEIDEQSDIFLLGATLYHVLTYEPPYDGEDIDEILGKAEKAAFPAPSVCNPAAQIPLALERIVLKAMAPRKQNRYASVQELSTDLDAFLAGRPACGRQTFSVGEKLIEYGDVSRDTYVIISGAVQVSRTIGGREHPIGVFARGEVIGEMAGITHQVRSATVTAIEPTEVLVISHELVMEELEKLPPWMEKIVFSLTDKIRVLDATMHPLMLKNRAYPIINQLYYIFSSARTRPDRDRVNFARKRVIDEIAHNLGIDRDSIAQVISVLIENKLVIETDQLKVPSLKKLALFVDYCRYKFEVRDGIKELSEIQIPSERNSYFRQIVRSLRALKMERHPHLSRQRTDT